MVGGWLGGWRGGGGCQRVRVRVDIRSCCCSHASHTAFLLGRYGGSGGGGIEGRTKKKFSNTHETVLCIGTNYKYLYKYSYSYF